jgi:hypothetical protein
MTQNRYGVLLSTLLLALLTAAFIFAARVAVNQFKSSVASANPTATATPMVLVTSTPVASAGSPHASATATQARQGATPTDTPFPQSGNVVVNSSGSDASHSMTSLPSGTSQVWCHVVVPRASAATNIRFRFQRVGTPGDYYDYPESVVAAGNESYIAGPLQAGQWRCLVEVQPSGTLVGSTSFSITP